MSVSTFITDFILYVSRKLLASHIILFIESTDETEDSASFRG